MTKPNTNPPRPVAHSARASQASQPSAADVVPEGVFAKLKEWLRERQSNYVEHSSWNGDTESGFYDLDEFDFEKLCEEIDAFSKDLKERK